MRLRKSEIASSLCSLAMTLSIMLFFVGIGVVKAQSVNGYVISGDIKGLVDGEKVTLTLTGDSTIAFVKADKFSFKGKVKVAGEPYFIKIAGKEDQLQMLLDNDSETIITGELTEWPKCVLKVLKSSPVQSFLDFNTKVQEPFSAAYAAYKAVMKSLTGKNKLREWELVIKQSRGIDSLRMVLSREVYKTATQTYIKGVFLSIAMNPDSYFTPELIKRWWPQADKKNAYNRLTERAKNSFYGKQLYEQVKGIEESKN